MRRTWLVCLFGLWSLACTGVIGPEGGLGAGGASGSATGSPQAGSGGQDPIGTGGAGPQAPDPGGCASLGLATLMRARLLSPRQYTHTVEDLLGVSGDFAKDFGGGAETQLDELAVERRANAAAAIARQAASTHAAWAPCTSETAACQEKIVEEIGGRAFRRPLSSSERDQLSALFAAGIADKDFSTGIEWLLTGLLQAPDFLYQVVRPTAGEQAGDRVPLGGFELTSRLSYFIWDSMPDAEAFAAAEAGRLAHPEGVEAEVRRMLGAPRAARGVESFYAHWLGAEGLRELARDDEAFDTALVQALGRSLLLGPTRLYENAAPSFADLFSGETYFMDARLRAYYGKGQGGTAFEATALPGEGRYGIITHPALMAQLARPQKTHPINRGLFVRGKLLCQELHAPDGVDIPQLPETPMAGVTTRQEVEEHANNPACSACHALLDPPGFALEHFDEVGRYRAEENGRDVDTSGTVVQGGDLDGPFASGSELLGRLGQSQTVRRCFAQQVFSYAQSGDGSRPLGAAEACALEPVSVAFAASGDLKDLIVHIATGDAFRLRLSEGGTP